MIRTKIGDIADPVERFFAFARERHSIYLKRAAGLPRPWTEDPVLQVGRFTNVFRELDRTTAWFRRWVRDPLRDRPEVLPATVIFRWFNRVSTGEALFCHPCLPPGPGEPGQSAFEEFISELAAGRTNVAPLRLSITQYLSKGPYVTGAYTINTISAGLGKTKLEGVLRLIEMWFERHRGWRTFAEQAIKGPLLIPPLSLKDFCSWVQSPCLGDFMAYEVACDLRWTSLLERAPDRLTWANTGPGAARGINRIFRPGTKVSASVPELDALTAMRNLLEFSRDASHWPHRRDRHIITDNHVFIPGGTEEEWLQSWPRWELREVEHTLCEFDKYSRVCEGAGQTRGVFDGRAA